MKNINIRPRAFFLTVILIFSTLLFLTIASKGFIKEAYAWDDCPKGLVNDPYPGKCPSYIDTDENGICDHSEPAPEDRGGKAQPEQEPDEQVVTQTEVVVSKKEDGSNMNINILAILAVAIPLVALISYTGYKKIKMNKSR